MSNLTSHQQQAFDKLVEYVKDTESTHLFHKFSGKAGSGKTFTIASFIKWYRDEYSSHQVFVAAPSHKALKNLVNALASLNLTVEKDYEARTVSSYLGKRPVMNVNTGIEEFVSNESHQPIKPNLLIVDEYSMIGKGDIISILSSVQGTGIKLIFVGDLNQLPPIGEDKSYLFFCECSQSLLSEVVRYSGELAIVADSYTKSYTIPVTKRLPIVNSFKDDTMNWSSKLDWIDRFVKRARHDIDTDNKSGSRILAYTNKACDKWNYWVRTELWEELKPFNIGDRLISTRPLFRHSKIDSSWQIAANNSSEFSVIGESYEKNISMFGANYDYHVVPVKAENNLPFSLFVISKSSSSKLGNDLDKYRKGKAWQKFYTLQNTFDSISFGYAITVHKSQGSTFDSAFLDLADIQKDGSRQMMYTALTRSKEIHFF